MPGHGSANSTCKNGGGQTESVLPATTQIVVRYDVIKTENEPFCPALVRVNLLLLWYRVNLLLPWYRATLLLLQ